MSAYSPASEVILRHQDEFANQYVLFAGDIQDDFPAAFDAKQVNILCSQYHHSQRLAKLMPENSVFFALSAEKLQLNNVDSLIYYWPKSKQEAQFQLESLLSRLPVDCNIFIVGENRIGVRSAENLLTDNISLSKIDSARRCSLYFGQLEKQASFNLERWWHSYTLDDLTINILPGVFSHNGLDHGSKLLLSTIGVIKGKVLDVGCGAGVIAAVLLKKNPELQITLADVNIAAITASQQTLLTNQLQGEVIISDVFSNIQGRYDVIVSNPPFHDGLNTDYHAATNLIRQAKTHLALNGKLIIVANAFLPYSRIIDETFGNHEVLVQTGRFKVYLAIHQPHRRQIDKKKR